MRQNKPPHKHTFHKAYKKTRLHSGTAYFLMWVCTTCPYKETFDLVNELPAGFKE